MTFVVCSLNLDSHCGLHDIFNNTLRERFLAGEALKATYHFMVALVFVSRYPGLTIINIVLFC